MAYQSDYHITFPERVDGMRGKRDLSTSEKVFFLRQTLLQSLKRFSERKLLNSPLEG